MSSNHTTLRISAEAVELLNQQISQENSSSFAYLSQAVWCDRKGFKGAAKLLYTQSEDERSHMVKIIDYLTEVEAKVKLPEAQKGVIKTSYNDLHDVFKEVFHNEMQVSQSIHRIITRTLEVQDYRTFSFLQWFLEEQREEERIAQRALELFDLMGSEGGVGLYKIDRALERLIEEDEKK